VLRSCSAFVCVSALLRDQVVGEFPHHADKVVVVPNAIPFEEIPPRETPVSKLRRWLYVGSFQERKGVRHVLEAFAVCHEDDPDLRLTMVGGGPQTGELLQRTAQLGLDDVVSIRDAVGPDEVFPLYHEHDLLVHASRYETFGMTVIEAIAAGLPVLVTRCGGPEETLRGLEQRAGALVDVGEGPLELVRGYRGLAARVDALDLAAAREELTGRYGYRAVGAALHALYTKTPPGGTA
jgi:glycogen synthase